MLKYKHEYNKSHFSKAQSSNLCKDIIKMQCNEYCNVLTQRRKILNTVGIRKASLENLGWVHKDKSIFHKVRGNELC